ncbi:MAG: tyrosine-type recombinase/integrase [Sandaracinaceae bacterium]|nr:tyrosine-type recombinase/integrase [Sandaracinaceae bacterium]
MGWIPRECGDAAPREAREGAAQPRSLPLARRGEEAPRRRRARLRTAIFVACLSEIRRAEMMSLRWSHVDLDARVIVLTKTKANRVRRIPINDALHAVLEPLREGAAPEAHVLHNKGAPWRRHALSILFAETARAAHREPSPARSPSRFRDAARARRDADQRRRDAARACDPDDDAAVRARGRHDTTCGSRGDHRPRAAGCIRRRGVVLAGLAERALASRRQRAQRTRDRRDDQGVVVLQFFDGVRHGDLLAGCRSAARPHVLGLHDASVRTDDPVLGHDAEHRTRCVPRSTTPAPQDGRVCPLASPPGRLRAHAERRLGERHREEFVARRRDGRRPVEVLARGDAIPACRRGAREEQARPRLLVVGRVVVVEDALRELGELADRGACRSMMRARAI